MSSWTHSICDDCWRKTNPGRDAVRLSQAPEETCCYCRAQHQSGIYVRGNPMVWPCLGACIHRLITQSGSDANLTVTWIDLGRVAQSAPDPAFPHGMDFDCSDGRTPTCETKLPYPAKGCGQYRIECSFCGFSGLISAAGRADDPRWVKIACKGVKT